VLTGILLALLATIIWSGNFIVARGVADRIPPVSLAFFRWATATVLLTPFGIGKLYRDQIVVRKNILYLLLVAITGIAIFNSLVYIAGHYSSAINMALIGTTSTPIFVVLIAGIFLNEKISNYKITGIIICIVGIILLLSKGSWERLLNFHFGTGDLWMLAAGFCFAVYSVLVRKKTPDLPPLSFLYSIFLLGTILLLPFFIFERAHTEKIQWDIGLLGVILFLGMGTSVIAFYCWNYSIEMIGAGNTALFGNLIPVFASIEAVWILNEQMTAIHIISLVLVLTGIILANRQTIQQLKR